MFLDEYEPKWVDIDGVRTRYFEAGEGPCLVCIHGGQVGDHSGGESAQDWDLNVTELSKRFRVIAIDRLGQGYTDLPKRDEDYTMAGAVKHVAALLTKLERGPYHLVGHSRGGYVASRITLDYPWLVESCIVIDSASAAPGEGRNDIVFACNPHPMRTLESSRYVYENYSYSKAAVTNEWLAMKQKIAELPKNREATRKMLDDGLLAARFLPDIVDDRDEMFRQIESDGFRRPVLLIWGYNDPTAPLSMGLRYFHMIQKMQPRTQMHIFNQAGHFSFRERAAEFNRVVGEFVTGVAHGE
jgi:2-hydroxy-6-oxonona-2,4-dienedioate hydrolase